MKLIRGLHNLRAEHRGGIATIGNFDGVHRGHQAVIAHMANHARSKDLPTTLISFEPTAAEFFSGSQAPPRLTRFKEKYRALANTPIDQFLCLRFEARLAALEPDEFVDSVLVQSLQIDHVVVGDDFRFGKNRKGDFETLSRAGEHHGFLVSQTETFDLGGERVSSSAVRCALASGNLQRARMLLGRPYSMSGRVIRGQCLGRKLGYPTANIKLGQLNSPLSGIFAVRVWGAGKISLNGVASLGTRPTVEGDHVLLEAHLFDFTGDLYGRELEVQFMAKLRDEARFPSLEALVEQMKKDEDAARNVLKRYA